MTQQSEDIVRRVSVLEALVNERFKAQETALTVAMIASEKRLDGLNEFRAALSDQQNKMVTRTESENGFSSLDRKLGSELDRMREKVDIASKPNYLLYGIMISACIALTTGMWVVIGLKIDTSTAPLSVLIEQVRGSEVSEAKILAAMEDHTRGVDTTLTQLSSENGQSRTDRLQINERTRHIESVIPQISNERRQEISDLADRLSRQEVWLEAVKLHIFGDTLSPIHPRRRSQRGSD